MVIGNDYKGSSKFNYHIIMTTTTPSNLVKMPNYENDELIVTKTEVILFSGDKLLQRKITDQAQR